MTTTKSFFIRSDVYKPDGSWQEDVYWSRNNDWNSKFKIARKFATREEADKNLAEIQALETPIRNRARVVEG